MKRLSILSQILVLALFACKKDETMVMVNPNATPPAITAASSGLTKVITSANMNDKIDFAWTPTNYGVSTQVTYTLQVDGKCNTFDAPLVLGSTSALTMSIVVSDLNTKLLTSLHLAPNRSSELQVRVISTINGNGANLVTSTPVALTVTPYADQPKTLWLGENSTSAPVLFATSAHTYEGYRYFSASESYRISDNPVCADSVFGSAGAGKLALTGAAQIQISKGYHKFKIDTKALTYDTALVTSFGTVGPATPGGWDNSTPMQYSLAHDIWIDTLDLTPGALKFRTNNQWTVNYGPASASALTGTLVFDDPGAVTIPSSGTYIVTLDFSQTKGLAYTYSINKMSDLPEPLKLWLPGGYEGFNPAAAPTIYAVDDAVYEGYVSIPAGTGFKFTSAPDYNHINYGDGGTPGKLTTDGTATDLSLGTAGYYRLTCDIKNLTYGIYLVNSWGLIGTATAGQWLSSTPMTFDSKTGLWSVTTDLTNGALKFRANDAWDVNYGPSNDVLAGSLKQTDNAISIPADGNYTITLDLTRSASPYQYVYSVVKN